MNDFSRKTIAALAKKGITIVGLQAIPDANGSFLNSIRGYKVDNNGCGRVLTFSEIMELVK